MPRLGLPGPLASFVAAGDSAVSLFFVLSGFVLAHVYGDQARADRPFPVRSFLVARFARVYPAYVAALVFALPALAFTLSSAADPISTRLLARACVAQVTMTQAWIPGWGCWWNCVGWSVSVEAFFYLMFPLLAPILLRQTARRLAVIAATGWLIAIAVLVVVPQGSGQGVLLFPGWSVPGLTTWSPLVRLPEFIIGICASQVLRSTDLMPRVGTPVTIAALALVVAAACQPVSAWREIVLLPGLALPYAVLIAAASAPQHRSLLASPLLRRLGDASYSLYLLHAVFLNYYRDAVAHWWTPEWAAGWVAFGVYVPVVLATSVVMHDRIEKPARRLLRGAFATGAQPA